VSSLAAALLLADGRFPAGGHAHSGGLEVAVERGRVRDLDQLQAFVRGRLATTGSVDAALAGATCDRVARLGAGAPWRDLVAEAEARQPSPALRAAGRAQGRQLLRAGLASWPGAVLDALVAAVPAGAPHPVALGACAAAAGLGPRHAALAAAHHAVTGPATAGVRLLGLDPFAVAALLAALAGEVDAVAGAAAGSAPGPLAELACWSAPRCELGAEDHASWEVRLFAS
jgi:urease accessory protein